MGGSISILKFTSPHKKKEKIVVHSPHNLDQAPGIRYSKKNIWHNSPRKSYTTK